MRLWRQSVTSEHVRHTTTRRYWQVKRRANSSPIAQTRRTGTCILVSRQPQFFAVGEFQRTFLGVRGGPMEAAAYTLPNISGNDRRCSLILCWDFCRVPLGWKTRISQLVFSSRKSTCSQTSEFPTWKYDFRLQWNDIFYWETRKYEFQSTMKRIIWRYINHLLTYLLTYLL